MKIIGTIMGEKVAGGLMLNGFILHMDSVNAGLRYRVYVERLTSIPVLSNQLVFYP